MLKMTEDVYFALIRYLVENGVIQWCDETKIIKDSCEKLGEGTGKSGYNIYLSNFVKIQLDEIEKDSSQILYFRDYLESW